MRTKTKSRPKREKTKTKDIDVAAELRAARSALEASDFATAMTHVATAWTALPAVSLAQLAVAIDKRLPRATLSSKIATREAEWLALASKHDPKALTTLLAADWPTHPREAKARLGELVEFPPDPRIAEALLALRAAKRYTSNAGDPFWKLAFLTIGGWGESRIAPLAEAAKKADHIDWWSIFQPVKNKVKLRPEPALTAAQTKEIAALAALAGAGQPAKRTDLDALLAAVYDDPGSDAPRLVYADALLAADDPRGEFIQLQLAANRSSKATTRMRALARAHGATWTDGVETATPQPEFRRGFISESLLVEPPANPPRGWRTVERVTFYAAPKPAVLAKFLLHDNLAHVKHVDGMSAATLPLVAARSFESIRITELAPAKSIASVPRVRELAIAQLAPDGIPVPLQELVAWYDQLPFDVELLAIDALETALLAGWTWFQTARTPRLALRGPGIGGTSGWELVLSRDGKRTTLAAIWHGGMFGLGEPTTLVAAIQQLGADALSSFTASNSAKLEPAMVKKLKRDLTRALAKQSTCKTSLFAE